MKKMMLILQLLAAHVMTAYSQQIPASGSITTQRLDVCFQKTTNLIFPAAIKSVDKGSADILVQKPEGIENVLKIKAAREYFTETNLTVITGEGRFYSFTIGYSNNPVSLVFQPGKPTSADVTPPVSPAIFSDEANNEGLIKSRIAQAASSKRNIRRVHDKTSGIHASLRGLYTANNMFFYKLILTNTSSIDYEIAGIRFNVEDRKKVKRVASQQTELRPLAITGDQAPVKAGKRQMIIVALPKHTVGKDKHLLVVVTEKNGSRNLVCLMKPHTFLKARAIR